MSVCRCLQKAGRSRLYAMCHPVVLGRAQQARTLIASPTTFHLQRNAHTPCTGSLRRAYWWSSKSAPQQSAVPSINNDLLHKQKPSQSNQNSEEPLSDHVTCTVVPDEPQLLDAEVSCVPDVSVPIPPPPLQLGDLRELGFSNVTPVGAFQAALEFIQVTTGLPWWATIVLTSSLVRLALLHFVINQTRAAAAMAPIRPQLDALMSEVKEARLAGDQVRAQVAILKVKNLQKETGTGIGSVIGGPFIQASTSIVMFLAIKKLCDFPLAQLKYEGVAWLPSLADADPYYLLPALSVALMNLQIYLGRVDTAAAGSTSMHFTNAFRIISLASFGLLAYLPSGLLIYLVSNVALVVVQGIFLRNAAVRRVVNLPPLLRPKPEQFPSMRDTWLALIKWFSDREKQAVAHAAERAQVPVFPAQSSSPQSCPSTPSPFRRTQRSSKPSVRGRRARMPE